MLFHSPSSFHFSPCGFSLELITPLPGSFFSVRFLIIYPLCRVGGTFLRKKKESKGVTKNLGTRELAASSITMAPRKTTTPAKAKPAAAAAAAKAAAPTLKLDEHGNEMDTVYWVRQYIGLVMALFAMATVCFAGYAPKFPALMEKGLTVNFFLYGGEQRTEAPSPHPPQRCRRRATPLLLLQPPRLGTRPP
jgi:hypothetical protein